MLNANPYTSPSWLMEGPITVGKREIPSLQDLRPQKIEEGTKGIIDVHFAENTLRHTIKHFQLVAKRHYKNLSQFTELVHLKGDVFAYIGFTAPHGRWR